MTNKFGERLRELRRKRNLLQREVAARLRTDHPLYSRIERGERRAKKEMVARLATILQADKEELLTLWLADQLTSLAAEENVALPALLLAEEEVRYILSRKKNK